MFFFFFSSRRRHTRLQGDWSSDVCSSDLTRRSATQLGGLPQVLQLPLRSIEPSALSAPAALASACRFVISGLRILCLKTSFVTAPVSAYNASTLVKLKRLRTSA